VVDEGAGEEEKDDEDSEKNACCAVGVGTRAERDVTEMAVVRREGVGEGAEGVPEFAPWSISEGDGRREWEGREEGERDKGARAKEDEEEEEERLAWEGEEGGRGGVDVGERGGGGTVEKEKASVRSSTGTETEATASVTASTTVAAEMVCGEVPSKKEAKSFWAGWASWAGWAAGIEEGRGERENDSK
jgi:hypothetical protein